MRVLMTGATIDPAERARLRAEFRQTRDPFDRAHGLRDADGLLRPAAVRRGSKVVLEIQQSEPRRYPPCYMTGSGVSFESALDETFERQRRLRALLGDDDQPLDRIAPHVARAMAELEATRGSLAARSLTRPGHGACPS